MGSEVVRVHSEGACLAYPELKEIGIAATRSLDEGRPVLVSEVP